MYDLRSIASVSPMSACGGRAPTASPRIGMPTAPPTPLAGSLSVHTERRVGEAGGALELDNGARGGIPAAPLARFIPRSA